MSVPVHILMQSLWQKESLDQCSISELKQLTLEYPYFDAAQVLLAKKLATIKDESSGNADLYKDQLQKTFLFFQNPIWLESVLNNQNNGSEVMNELHVKVEQPIGAIEPTAAPIEEVVVKPVEELVSNPVEEVVSKPVEEAVKSPIEETPIQHITNPSIEEHASSPVQEESKNPVEDVQIVPEKAELSFEPFHTVDYFASQGIKYVHDEVPKDKFGQQLKSFTEWLKAMKRLPLSEIVSNIDETTGKKVEQMAEHSLEEREIITEAMAEVWKKQGKMEKAVEIYNKLSLLDPSKSHYFAAKIEQLK